MLELYYLFLTYLLASVPTGYLLAALYADVDLRTQGSGNIGATNAGRVVGTGVALVTLAGCAVIMDLWRARRTSLSTHLRAGERR